MIIFFWLTCLVLFILTALLLLNLLFRGEHNREALHILINGFKEGLKGSGLGSRKKKYAVELWVWKTMDDDHVCEDCFERSTWPPMDIADWMKEGLPRTPESETHCGEDCRCQLVPYNPKKFAKHPYKN